MSLSEKSNSLSQRLRCVRKLPPRSYQNAKGPGSFFKVVFLDEEGREIGCVFFNSMQDRWIDVLQEQQVYEISNVRVAPSKKQPPDPEQPFELSATEESQFDLLSDDAMVSRMPMQSSQPPPSMAQPLQGPLQPQPLMTRPAPVPTGSAAAAPVGGFHMISQLNPYLQNVKMVSCLCFGARSSLLCEWICSED